MDFQCFMFPDQNVLNILMFSVIKLITVEEQKSGAQSFQIGRETNDRHLFYFGAQYLGSKFLIEESIWSWGTCPLFTLKRDGWSFIQTSAEKITF